MPMRPCWVEISTRSLEDNYKFLQSLAGPSAECLAIVKANAYGHSLELCAPAAVRAGARWLGVSSVEEGLAARAVCPQARVLVLGGVFPGQAEEVVAHGLTAAVWTMAQIEALDRAARSAGARPRSVPVHLEIDTGMSRQGVALEEIAAAVALFSGDSPLRFEAVMTHLYASDEADHRKSTFQIAVLQEALQRIEAAVAPDNRPQYLSAGATAALLGGDSQQLAVLASRHELQPMLRLGLALYGVAPHFEPRFEAGQEPANLSASVGQLQPVLAWKTRVTSLRQVPAGAEIGYNGTFVATEPMSLALLAIGYADGLDRALGNHFSLLVRGQRAPIVGRISMDQTVIDVTEIPDVAVGDEVVILGTQEGETISAFEHAEVSRTIPWEVFTRIGARVARERG